MKKGAIYRMFEVENILGKKKLEYKLEEADYLAYQLLLRRPIPALRGHITKLISKIPMLFFLKRCTNVSLIIPKRTVLDVDA